MSAWSSRWCPSLRSATLPLLATLLLLTAAAARAAPPAPADPDPAPYPADFDPFQALPAPPPWAAQATFSADAAALADQLATQDRVWARVDLRVPTPDLDRLTPAQRQAWQSALARQADALRAALPGPAAPEAPRPADLPSLTLALDATALAVLRTAPQVAAVEALPPVVRAAADPPLPAGIRRPDEYLVSFPPQVFSAAGRAAGQTGAEVARLAALLADQHQGQVVHHWGHALAGVGLRLSAAAAAALAADPRVAHLEPNQRIQVHAVQAAPPWGLDRSDQRALPLNQAYEYTAADADGVTVYIIDTGIRVSHADFADRATWGANLIDAVDRDCHGHGTHVAGTVAGTTYGVAKGARLVAVKVLDCTGSGTLWSVLGGLDWVVAQQRAPAVVNMSLGSYLSPVLNEAVATAVAAGLTVVVAAGNDHADACQYSPAAAPAALTVSATGPTDARAAFSNDGACVDLLAPGVNIPSAGAGSDSATATLSGTSMATPHVAGAAALVLGRQPGATPAAVAEALTGRATADVLSGLGAGTPNRLLYADAGERQPLTVIKEGFGRVLSAPPRLDCGPQCAADFLAGTVVALAATPAPGSVFAGWRGDPDCADGVVTLTAATTCTARFTALATAPLALAAEVGPAIALPRVIGAQAVRHPSGWWPLTSEPSGMTGVADLNLTLSADAGDSLVIGTQTLAPGAQLTLSGYDFAAHDGRLTLPLRWAHPEQLAAGEHGALQVDINQAVVRRLSAPLRAWSPAERMTVTGVEPAYARLIQPVRLALEGRDDPLCPEGVVGVLAADATPPAAGPDGRAQCAGYWIDPPGGLAPLAPQPARLAGYLAATAGTVPLRYQPGLLVAQDGVYHFLPDGAPVLTPLAIVEPAPPELTYQVTGALGYQTDWLPDGSWPTRPGRHAAGRVLVTGAPYPGVTLQITDEASGAVLHDLRSTTSSARAVLTTELAALGDEQRLRLRAFYTRHPEVVSDSVLHFVALPGKLSLNLQRPVTPHSAQDLVLTGAFGAYREGAYHYDAATMGTWRLQLYRETASAGGWQREALGTPTEVIEAAGGFALPVGRLAAGRHRLVAEAVYRSPHTGPAAKVSSSAVTLTVADGAPVACQVTTAKATGTPGTAAAQKVVPADRHRHTDVGKIAWAQAVDDGDWQALPAAPDQTRAFAYVAHLPAAGIYRFQATLTNRHSGLTAVCAPSQVHIYDVPTLTLSGPEFTFTGHAVTWTASSGADPRPVDYRWRVRRGLRDDQPLTGTGPEIHLPADITATWSLEVLGRYAAAPDIPSAWQRARGAVAVLTPRLRTPLITGPAVVETGQTYAYAVTVLPLHSRLPPPEGLTITGEWLLPDGRVLPGETLDYAVTPATDQVLRYRAWVPGYRPETETVAALPLRPWTYVFPTFAWTAKVLREYDPTTVRYTVSQTRTPLGDEPLTYTWDFPPQAQVDQRHDADVTVALRTTGSHPLRLRITDTRGHEAVLEETLTVPDPPAITLDTRRVVGDQWRRAPAPVTVYWYAGGLLEQERVTALRLLVNGQVVSDRLVSNMRFEAPRPGDYALEVQLETNYGRTANAPATVTLIAGEPPHCALTANGDGVTALTLKAQCTVPMGRIARYQWQLRYADAPGAPVAPGQSTSAAVSFSPAQLARGLHEVQLIATNDKGQASPVVRWTP